MTIIQILILGLIQGAAELLPISSSAHVIVTAKLMGLNPTSPEMTFLLVMLHTGTMFAVLIHFWKRWKISAELVRNLFVATLATGVVGFTLKYIIEKIYLSGHDHPEIELLFGSLPLISFALAEAGALIIFAGFHHSDQKTELGAKQSFWIGIVQGCCVPFRGFSRSGATISTGMLQGVSRAKAEDFSFALAVVLTPPVIFREAHRLTKAFSLHINHFKPGLIGMTASFIAGLIALRLLSNWLDRGRWQYFGIYNLIAAMFIMALYINTM